MPNFNKVEKNIEKKIEDNENKRLEECIPVAKEVLKIIGNSEYYIGILNDKNGMMIKEVEEEYANVASKILQLFLEKNVAWWDRNYIFQLALQAFDETRKKVLTSLDKTFEAASNILWEKEIMDLKMNDINNVFKDKIK